MFKTPFKPIGHYVFDYKPRYYDERKERLEALEQRYKNERNQKENPNDDEYQVTLTKNNLKNEWSRTRSNAKADAKSTYRLAIIITILAGIALYILR
ncbi:hypothetical protein [Ochrovirga pacifica]|uniref:hypothetical protein n=1 Tax=Ochrovirga pacifica TaxID=1042376 RepID=UPI000255A7AD|nr:hypothetical protein [Ochrovirga pacifica]